MNNGTTKTRIFFKGLDTRPLTDESEDGLCEYMNNMRPQGPENNPYWTPIRDIETLTIDSTIPELPTVACEAVATSGGEGVSNTEIALDPSGGFVCIDCQAFGVPDKFEIIHNGIKVATSGMTVANSGPFDETDLSSADQYIGTSKGTIPNRDADFLSDTGLTISSAKQQLVWWEYDSSDYAAAATCTVRVTGPNGTAWNFTRRCAEDA